MSAVYYIVIVGIAAAFNPCGIAMLPSYISYLIGSSDQEYSHYQSIRKGIQLGITMTAGFLLVFVITGFTLSFISRSIITVLPAFSIVIAVLLILLGLGMLLGKHLPVKNFSFQVKTGKGSIFLYGIAYAIGSLGCTLPMFLLVVSQSMTDASVVKMIMNFMLFSIGMGLAITIITILSLVSRTLAQKWIRKFMPIVQQLMALIILLSGVYLLIYWTYGPIF